MKYYIVVLIHLMIWSFYTLAGWLSKGDSKLFHGLLFVIFFYLCLTAARTFLPSGRQSMAMTLTTLLLYWTGKAVADQIL
ncbi:hypothetical protein [Bacillus thermotolerans]|uniref:Uncharacterized protein n=1 Tax=Bacillus thermotolerans TaxID=1221996 RepID=A0A0F5IAL7_BACTR|nr:hypothetical protein [Bacillus thermotolerans]KKB39198.1 hypothetical protein QY97_00100 [Bacillus thermotolerans]KKB41954.1 hypothetical protein QY96_01749 [Bacillus thermotolerans]KKB42212.1 hypothetical protein QY95_00061 [Bacillus thermotolerans]